MSLENILKLIPLNRFLLKNSTKTYNTAHIMIIATTEKNTVCGDLSIKLKAFIFEVILVALAMVFNEFEISSIFLSIDNIY